MPIKIKSLDGLYREIDVSRIKVKDLIKELGLSIEGYITVKKGLVITEEDVVENGDEIILYPVVSGG